MRIRLAALLICVLLGASASALGGTPAGSADARYARAGRLISAGDLDEAYAVLEKLAADHPARWAARCKKRMAGIKKLVAVRDEVRARAARLREAAGVAGTAGGELAPWLLVESARLLCEAHLYSEALADATAVLGAGAYKKSRFRPAAALLAARCYLKTGKPGEAGKAWRQALAGSAASRAERAAAWQGLTDLVAASGNKEELRKLLEEHIRRGPEEPGVAAAVERLIAESLTGPKQALRGGKVLGGLIKGWPARALHPESVLAAAKIAEFVARDYARAEKLYRLVLERYPEACFDLTMLEAGKRRADAGREVLLAAMGRAAAKREGRVKVLKAPRVRDRGKSPQNALAAVLAALRAGDLKAARECAAGKFAGELGAKRHPFRRYGFSDYQITGAKVAGESATVSYEVAGELGVTRVLKKKARATRTAKGWKIVELGL